MTKLTETAAELRRWARRQVGLDENAPADRAAVLRRLAEEAFVPPPGPDYAARVLSGGAAAYPADAGWQQALVDLESACRDEVEAFATEFFSLGGEQRQQRWQELRSKCTPFPCLAARLTALEAGLCVELAELEGPAGELGQMVGELFVLRPGLRGRCRRALLKELENERGLWEDAAEQLRQRQPMLAALEPVFVGAFLDRELHRARVRLAKKPPRSSTGSWGKVYPSWVPLEEQLRGDNGSWLKWIGWIGIILFAALAHHFTSTSSDLSRPAQEMQRDGWQLQDGRWIRIVKARPRLQAPQPVDPKAPDLGGGPDTKGPLAGADPE